MPRRTSARARLLAVALVAAQGGCSSTSNVPLGYPQAELVADRGEILLHDEEGRTTPVTADSTLVFVRKDGSTSPRVSASDLCRTATGFAARVPGAAGCEGAFPLARFDDVQEVRVASFDRAGTTAIVIGIAAVVIVAIVVVLAATDDKKKSSSSSDESEGSSSSSSSGSRSSGASGDAVAPALDLGGRMIAQAAADDAAPRPLRTGEGAVFDDVDRRRATVQGLLSVDVSGSAFSPIASGGGRLGVRLFDFFDAYVGVRAIGGRDHVARPTPFAGLGLHGPFPRARWLALGLGFEGGAARGIDLYASAYAGLRVAPFSHLWIGLYPVHPAYVGWSGGGGWYAMSSLDIAYTF